MSFSHLLSSGRSHYDSQSEHISAGEGPLPCSVDNTTLDPDVLRRVARLSLSRPQVGLSPNADEESSQSPTDLFNVLASTPLSTGSGSATSFDFETHSLSEPMSSLSPQPSLYSLTDSLKEQSVRWEYGRRVNTHSEVYKLAADEEEARRQDMEHRIYKAVFGDYVPPFREVLEENSDPVSPQTCLDVGCGSGSWILQVASDFPHVSCTGVDLVPLPAIIPNMFARTQIPSNLRFEVDDVSLGLEHFAGDFDVVHARSISCGIRDYYRLIDDAAVALRPRGLADFMENDWRAYDLEKRAIVPTTKEIWGSVEPPNGWTGTGMARSGTSPSRRSHNTTGRPEPSPFVARFITLARQAVHKRGGHVDAAPLLHRWISEHRAYEDVVYREAWLPIGDWLSDPDVQKHPLVSSMTKEEFEKLRWVGKETGEDMLEFMRSARPLLLSTGVPQDLVDLITEKASQEIREARTPLYILAQNVYARKKERRQDVVMAAS